jgi:cytochrome P450 family 6
MFFQRAPIGHLFANIYKQLDGEKYGGTYAITKPGFIFRDPDVIKNVLVKDFSSFHDRGFFMDEELEPLSGHLFLLPGKRWRNLRVKLSPTFTSGKMKMMYQTLVDCGQELGSILEKSAINEEIIEIKDFLVRYSTDVISSCAFGIQCNSLKNPDAEFRE